MQPLVLVFALRIHVGRYLALVLQIKMDLQLSPGNCRLSREELEVQHFDIFPLVSLQQLPNYSVHLLLLGI